MNNELFANHSWYFRNALVRANYKNAVKGIDYTPVYLERFFRNLLLGERWDLRNRYLHIKAPEQAQDKYRTSTEQVEDLFHTDNVNIRNLIKIIGDKEMSVKAMMEGIGLKGRDNFLNQYLTPALSQGYVRMLYPESPRHPRQKYLLTPKGIGLFDYLNSICKK